MARIAFAIRYKNEERALESAFALGDTLTATADVNDWHTELIEQPHSRNVLVAGWIETDPGDSEEEMWGTITTFGSTALQADGYIDGVIASIEIPAE